MATIDRAINASIELRSKELIKNFIAEINISREVDKEWSKFVGKNKEADIDKLIDDEKLKPKKQESL